MRKSHGIMEKPLLLDGPVGTEIESRGGDTSLPLWSARALLETPELIREIHEDYLKAGADIMTTNTFRTQEWTLSKLGYRDKANMLTRLAVNLCKQAIENSNSKALIAGSISPLEDCYRPDLTPNNRILRREHQKMTDWLYAEGVDVFLVETMNSLREAEIIVDVAKSYNIPIWVSFTCDNNGNVLGGDSWESIFKHLGEEIKILMVNCSTVFGSELAFKKINDFYKKFGKNIGIGVYPNFLFQLESEEEITNIRLNYYSRVKDWLEYRPKIIGTCCGATPEDTYHIRKLIDNIYGI